MSAAELEDLKATLKSLVVSCPTSMDARALARDYREMNGDCIPYAKYGYRELISFLKERCTDCFVFSGHPANPIITPIITERTRHINNLISKQRTNSKDARFKVKRTSMHESQVRSRYNENKRRYELNTVPAPQAIRKPITRPGKVKRTSVHENQIRSRNDARRRSEVNIVPAPYAVRTPIAQIDNRYSAKPVTKFDYVKHVDKHTENSGIISKGAKVSRDEKWTVHHESRNSGKDIQTTEVKIVRGGELRSIENQLIRGRVDKECFKGSALKNAIISDTPTLNALPRLIQKNAAQNVDMTVPKRAITKEPFRKEGPASSQYVQTPTFNAYPQFIQKKTSQKDNVTASKGAIPKEFPREGRPTTNLPTTHRRSPETSAKPSSRTGYSAAALDVVQMQLKKLLDANPNGIWLEELEQIYNDMFESELNYKGLGHVSLGALCGELGDVLRLESVGGRNKQLVVPAGRPASPHSSTPSPSQHAQARYNVLYLNSIKSQIQEMLDSYPEGVWLQELAEVYRDMFGCDVDYRRLGHASLESLCGELGGVLRLERAGGAGEALAVAAGRPSPRHPPAPPRSRLARYDDPDELSGDSEDALAGMPYDEGIFPEDCMDRLQSIPRLPVSALAEACVLEVLVSEVLDPSHFWFQLRSDQHDLALNALMDEMTEYYTNGAGRDRVMQFGAVQVGQYCATKFDVDGWHRSIIVQLIGPQTVKVRHVDYGSVITVGRKELRYLPKVWAALPAQAMRGCLAQLRPAGGASCWMHSAAGRFLELVNNRPLVAEIHSVDAQAQVVRMFLADTTSEEDVYINRKLVDENRASYVDFKTQTLGDFLLPSFDDVENGKAMNYGDKCDLMRSGIFPEGVEQPFRMPVAVVRRDDGPPLAPPAAAPTCGRSTTSGTRIPLCMPNGAASRCSSREKSPALLAANNRIPLPSSESPISPSADPHSPFDCEIDKLSLSFSQMNGDFTSRAQSQLSCSTVEINHDSASKQRWAGWRTQSHTTNGPHFQNERPENPKLDSEKCQSEAPIPMPDDFTHYSNYTTSLSAHPPPRIPEEFNNDLNYPMKKTSDSRPQWPSSQHISQYPHVRPPNTYSSQLEITQPDSAYQYHAQHENLNTPWPPAQNYNAGSYMHSTQYPNMNCHPQPTYDPNVNSMFHQTQYPNISHSQHTQHSNMAMFTQPMYYPNVGSLIQPSHQPYEVIQHPNTPLPTQPIQYPYRGVMQPVPHSNMAYSMQSAHVPKEYSTNDGMRKPDVSSVWDLAKDINILPTSNSIQMALSALDTQYREMKMSIAGVAPPNLTQTRPSASNDNKHNPTT